MQHKNFVFATWWKAIRKRKVKMSFVALSVYPRKKFFIAAIYHTHSCSR